MALKIKFEDYSVKVTKELENAAFNFLEESGGLVESKVKDLTRVASGETRREWGHVVDKSGLKVTIGNPNINALWEERGGNPVSRINRAKSVFKLLLNYVRIISKQINDNEERLSLKCTDLFTLQHAKLMVKNILGNVNILEVGKTI